MKSKIILITIQIALALFSQGLKAEVERKSCYCKIKTSDLLTPVRQTHFPDAKECLNHLQESEIFGVWGNICSESGVAKFTLNCGTEKIESQSKCRVSNEHHQFLIFNDEASVPRPNSVFDYHGRSKFELRKTFSYLAHFMKQNKGLDLSNSLYGGIYEEGSNYRIDLTIVDFYLQVKDALNRRRLEPQYIELLKVVNNDPIKNFYEFYNWLDNISQRDRKVRRALKLTYPIIYDANGIAKQPERALFDTSKIFTPRKNKDLALFNEIVGSKNKNLILKYIVRTYFPETNLPISVQHLASLDRKKLEREVLDLHFDEYVKRVRQLNANSEHYTFHFEMAANGDSILKKVTLKNENADPIEQSIIDTYNYIHNRLSQNSLKSLFEKRPDFNLSLQAITPVVVKDNFEFWEEIVQEDSWSYHITAGNDKTLLVLRNWMRDNQEDILSKSQTIELSPELKNELNLWKKARRPKRALTLDFYSSLASLYPKRPWEEEFVLNERGEKSVIGEMGIKKTIRTVTARLKSFGSVENVASAVAATGVMSLTANAYLSATASTFIHDFITAKRYGYEVRPYLLENTPGNLASSLIFASGFTPGRTADAIFRGAATGAFQSAMTGDSIKLGMIVGGLSGGLLQQLPPEASNWIVSGENKQTLNMFSEIAEQAFFKGLNGAIVGYYQDGDWKKGLKSGAAFGAGYATFKIVIFGTRYDANAYISDEEIAEYNQLHNYEDGYYRGEHLQRETRVMVDRYGKEINITRDDVKRAQFREGGLLMKGRAESGALGTNFSGPFGSEIGMADGSLTREETLLHEVMHTRQMQQGRMLNLLNRIGPNSVPEGFWEEYISVGEATLPKGYYRTFLYTDLKGDF